MGKRWSEERIWNWYNSRPWIRGCNYMSADCANRIDQWQSLGFEKRMETAEKELALAESIGFNSLRLVVDFVVWRDEHDTFFERFDRYLDMLKKHNMTATVVLANDCMPPKNDAWNEPKIGVQTYDWGYHGGRKNSQHGTFSVPGFHVLDEEESREQYYRMIKGIVEKHKNDERIIIWDVYNEAGNSNRQDITMPHLKKIFEIIREIDPIQPLTSCVWNFRGDPKVELLETEKYSIENSDIISYHSYSDYQDNIKEIKRLKAYNRPIINTEWLGRCYGNTVEEMFPLFYLEGIACYNWGFVAGKYQTYEPWNKVWDEYEENPDMNFDFTKWFHDLYRPNHHPYNPKEIDIIKEYCDLADKDFEQKKEKNK